MSSTNGQIVVVGSLNQDLVVTLRRFPGAGETVAGDTLTAFCGGKGANQAYAAGRLGGRAVMVGQVGCDAAADVQLRNLASAGVDTRAVRRVAGLPTGTAFVVVDSAGENRIVVIPGANGAFGPDAVAPSHDALREAAVVLAQLEVPLETVAAAIRIARTGAARVILDPAPAQPLPDALLAQVDYLTPNLSELALLVGRPLAEDAPDEDVVALARTLCGRGVGTVVAKRGAGGVLLVSAGGCGRVAAFPVKAVDTTGAGDCFNGAFATALVGGASEVDACRFAAAAAAISVTKPGAQASMPTRREVDVLMEAHGTALCG